MEKDDNNDEAKKSYPLEQKSMTEEPKKKEKQKPMIDEEHIPIEVQRIIDNYKKRVPFTEKDFRDYLAYKHLNIKFK